MVITKHSLRILRYIYHQKSVSYLKLKKKFKVPDLDESLSNLVRACYVIQVGGSVNKYGEPMPILENTFF